MQQVLPSAAGMVRSLTLTTRRRPLLAMLAGLAMLSDGILAAAVVGPVQAAVHDSATLTVRPMAVADPRMVSATVESLREAALRTPVAGTVTGLAAVEGDRLRAGDPVAVVTDARLAPRHRALEARARSAAAEQRRAELEMDRASRLRASGSGTQQRFEDARAALDIATAQAAAVSAEMAVIDAERADGVIRAPADGVLRRIDRPEGAQVQPGEAIAQFAPDDRVLRLRLPERHAALLNDRDELVVHLPDGALSSTSGPAVRARVLRIHPGLENGALLVDAELAGLSALRLGQSLHVSVSLGARTVLAVPMPAITRRHGMEFVRLTTGEDVPVRTGGPVQPISSDQTLWVEVLSGLQDGDVLVIPTTTRRGQMP